MFKFRSTVFSLLAVVILTAFAGAQVRRIPSTGCPNAPYPTTAGHPAIGQGFGVIAAPCRTDNGHPFIIIGTHGANLTLPHPPACRRGCVLACRPIVVLNQAAWRTIIPRDRNLVGAHLCFQTGCIEAVRPACVLLHGALSVRITP